MAAPTRIVSAQVRYPPLTRHDRRRDGPYRSPARCGRAQRQDGPGGSAQRPTPRRAAGVECWSISGHYSTSRRTRRQLLAPALAVLAARPATGPALAFLQLFMGPADAAFSGRRLLGIVDPADELVAGQRRDVLPGSECRGVGDQRLTQVCGQLMHHARRALVGCSRGDRRACRCHGELQGDATSWHPRRYTRAKGRRGPHARPLRSAPAHSRQCPGRVAATHVSVGTARSAARGVAVVPRSRGRLHRAVVRQLAARRARRRSRQPAAIERAPVRALAVDRHPREVRGHRARRVAVDREHARG